MNNATDLIHLPDAARAMAEITGGPTKPYTTIYKAVLNGKVPVIRGDNGRYSFERSKLPEIARALGLTVLPQFAKQIAA